MASGSGASAGAANGNEHYHSTARGAKKNGISYETGDAANRVAEFDDEIQSIDAQIASLKELRSSIVTERNKYLAQQQKAVASSSSAGRLGALPPLNNGYSGATNYHQEQFPWSRELLPRAKQTWGIEAFRSVQEAVCNAAIDGRDIVCVMPTGGGKSLCYQLPAVMSNGLTLVISPLISLSTDQMWHLREAGVMCEMMSSADSRDESNEILRRVRAGSTHTGDDIKVLFVTPERVAKSKTLLSALQKCYERDLLARIVIDEAHCCSQMGHDFRPDYKKLSILQKIYPNVPFLCLSATLAPRVLEDVRHILGLPRIVDPCNAPREGTLYFTAPLHRPNLHYTVVNRPSAARDANQAITNYILAKHPDQCGIVYTLSRADTQRMADALTDLSSGRIRAAVYHADLEDGIKSSIHDRWRRGIIQVVVATIAFGMGIDKGDVRFVLHASLGKSVDSYYQETGRAGRDGNDADCVLFYRPADAARVSGLLAGDPGGQQKLHSMLEYAQSPTCRKSIFGQYFQDRYGDGSACGTCDNCLSPPQQMDVTSEAWKLVRVLEEVYQEGGRITLAGLGDLARGLGGGQYTVVEATQAKRKRRGGGKGAKQSGFIDIAETVGEKVKLSKDDTERVLVELHLKGYIADEFNATAYSVNVYARPGPMSLRLTRHTAEEIATKTGCPTVVVAVEQKAAKRSKATSSSQAAASADSHAADVSQNKGTKGRFSRKKKEMSDPIATLEEDNDESNGESSKPLAHARDRMSDNIQRSSRPKQRKLAVKNEQTPLRGHRPGKFDEFYDGEEDIMPGMAVDENGWEVYSSSAAAAAAATGSSGASKQSPIELDSD